MGDELKSEVPCKFFQSGGCTNDRCKFSHSFEAEPGKAKGKGKKKKVREMFFPPPPPPVNRTAASLFDWPPPSDVASSSTAEELTGKTIKPDVESSDTIGNVKLEISTPAQPQQQQQRQRVRPRDLFDWSSPPDPFHR